MEERSAWASSSGGRLTMRLSCVGAENVFVAEWSFTAASQAIVDEFGLPWYAVNVGPKGCVMFTPQRVTNYRDFIGLDSELWAASFFYLVNRGILLPPGPMLRGTVSVPEKNLHRWNEMLAKQRAPALGSCDAHSQWWSRMLLGGPVGVYERIFKVVTTHVLVKQLDEASVVDALRRGRSYVVMDVWRDGTGFSFTATDGAQTWQMGDEIQWSGKPIKLTTYSPVMGFLRVLKDGIAIATDDGRSGPTMIDATGPGVYRAEVSFNGKLWILSNPIYVR
jgi:hypothetical protein